MKIVKNTLSVLLCLIMLFSFAACRDKGEDVNGDEVQTTVNTYESPKQLSELGLSLEKLEAANKIEALMKKYNTVTVKGESSSEASYILQVFKHENSIAYAVKRGEAVSGFIKGFSFVVESDRVKAYCDLEDLEEGQKHDIDDAVIELFEDKKLVAVEEGDTYYKLESLSEDKGKAGKRYFKFDKESLALTAVSYENAVGNTEKVEITFDGELESFAKKIADGFVGELKKIKVVGEIVTEDTVKKLDVELSLPADWEYVPSGDGRIDYYMNEAMDEPYAYPGHSKDYTIYVSNVFEDEDNGKK